MLWFKAFHIIALVAWFAGLFYLPRLFVYHTLSQDSISIERFKIMERRLYYGIMWPSALLTTIFGMILLLHLPQYYLKTGWMHIKLLLVVILWIYHLSCGHCLKLFKNDRQTLSTLFFRIYNEIPTLLLIMIVLLVVIKP